MGAFFIDTAMVGHIFLDVHNLVYLLTHPILFIINLLGVIKHPSAAQKLLRAPVHMCPAERRAVCGGRELSRLGQKRIAHVVVSAGRRRTRHHHGERAFSNSKMEDSFDQLIGSGFGL